MAIDAVLWDFDGTLCDSSQKTIDVTLDVLSNFIPDIRKNIPPELSSKEAFNDAYGRISDWKELYRSCYGLNEDQIISCSKMWGKAQLNNKTEPMLFPKTAEILEKLMPMKMGICTQNSRDPVIKNLEHHGVLKYFGAVLGIDDVDFDEQKPNPSAFIKCLEALNIENFGGNFVYIGDHNIDIEFGRNSENFLKKSFPDAKVICIALHHSGSYEETDPDFPPDFIAKNNTELYDILCAL